MFTRVFNRVRGVVHDVFEHDSQSKKEEEEMNFQKLSDSRTGIPTTKYAAATGKAVLQTLGSAAGLIPVPMLKDAIELARKVIELCEEASAVGKKVKDLQDRVSRIMVVVLAHITDKSEEGDQEAIVSAARLMEGDIKALLKTLDSINSSLEEMKDQSRLITIIYKDIHMERLDECMSQLAVALEQFKFANDLSDSDLLHILDKRLQNLATKIDAVYMDMGLVRSTVDRVENKVDNFGQVMAEVQRTIAANLRSSDIVSRQTMPLKPGVFYGRDGLVEDIVQSLMTEATSHICILGPSGMGKTSVSLAVVESPLVQARFGERCVWVPCIGATSTALLLEILYVQLRIPGETQVNLDKVISELNNSADPRLILFDNFETPWNAPGGTQKQVEDILRQLARLDHVAILMTMRGSNPPCHDSINWQSKNIEPTDEEACFRIYHTINPASKDDPDVGPLLHALGYMPFAVTLMANLGFEGQSTAEELLQAWKEEGTDVISDENNPERSINRSIGLSVDSHLVKQDPNAILLLSVLSLLPEGTTKENLHWWAPTLKSSKLPTAVATLSKAGLLSEHKQQSGSSIFFVVPVVQSFMQQHERISDEVRKQVHASCCRYVLAHECRYDHPEFSPRSKALAAEDANIQSILFDRSSITPNSDISETTLKALIAFCWYRCDTKPSPDLAEHALEVARASGIEQHIAVAAWCLGRTYHQVSDYLLSLEHLKKAYILFGIPADLQWQKLSEKCGLDLVQSACQELGAEQAIQLAYNVEARCAALADDLIHAKSLSLIGRILHEAGRGQEALQYLYRAETMLQGAGSALDIAEAYQSIGRVHYQEQRIPEALDAMEEARRYAEMTNVPSIQGDTSLDLGMVLHSANRVADARKYIEKALVLSSQLGNTWEAAIALEYMGYGYLRQGDYQVAYSAYGAAADKYGKYKWDYLLARCQANMEKITQKLSNPDERIGFERPEWDPVKNLLYPLDEATETETSSITSSDQAAAPKDSSVPSASQ